MYSAISAKFPLLSALSTDEQAVVQANLGYVNVAKVRPGLGCGFTRVSRDYTGLERSVPGAPNGRHGADSSGATLVPVVMTEIALSRRFDRDGNLL